MTTILWRCPRCTLDKPPAAFYAKRPGVAGAAYWCIACVQAYHVERRHPRKKRLKAAA